MKVLWITNILFPEAESQLVESEGLKSSGGWMLGAAEALSKNDNVKLYVAAVSHLVNELTILNGKRTRYYVMPIGKGNVKENKDYQYYWNIINSEVAPDVVHIHGTEYSHGHAYMKACGSDNVVISIQGMISACHYYYSYGITRADIYKNITFRDILRGTIITKQREYRKRAEYETDMLKMSKHIIGRTSWDKARAWAINPEANYYICNETLRPEFYEGHTWNYENCRKHSIFLSQAGYPIKGFHQLLKAMPLILQHYPDAVVRIAGHDIIAVDSARQFLKLSGYGQYIRRLIAKYNLEKHVEFTGNLNAGRMRQEYLDSNVFVCPSAIENSPNSVGEAQILGVPCVASYVGGIMDLMKGNEENLYRFEEIEMLAYKICKIFADKESQVDMRAAACRRHDPETNSERLLSIYESIISMS